MLTQRLSHNSLMMSMVIVLSMFIIIVVVWNTNHATAATPVTLPIEVVSPDGGAHEKSVAIDMPNSASATQLWIQAHGLTYQEKASVKINNGDWIALRNDTSGLAVAAPARYFGGIGGGHQTIKLTLDLPEGTVQSGTNTIAFRFNQTDGRASAFRILQFNFLDANGNKLVPDSAFTQEDPDTWQPPFTSTEDIAKGEQLWQEATLVESPGQPAIKARCASCHTQDGIDLKYYNYSNESIVGRSMFHGLSEKEGKQIASYIRTQDFTNPGRPWNPPFQPGPGLDDKPALEWAAGAGIEWALDSDAETAEYLPDAKSDVIDRNRRFRTVNSRETPLVLQFLDWNHWLPEVHPVDAIGEDAFFSHDAYTRYVGIRDGLEGKKDMSKEDYLYRHWRQDMDRWKNFVNGDDSRDPNIIGKIGTETPEKYRAAYDANLWAAVKSWEIMQEFNLNEANHMFYGVQGEPRSWHSNRMIFNVGPHIMKFPPPPNEWKLIFDASQPVNDWAYATDAWYEMSMILGGGARGSWKGGHHDNDWKYLWFFIGDGRGHEGTKEERHRPMQGLAMSYKSIQEIDGGFGPDGANTDSFNNTWWGFSVRDGRPELGRFFDAAWQDFSMAEGKAKVQPLFEAWIEHTSAFSAEQWSKANFQEFNRPADYQWGTSGEAYPDYLRDSITTLRDTYNADASVVNGLANFGKYVYPNNDWDGLKIPTSDAMATPSGVLVEPGPDFVKVTWDAVTDATSYNVLRADSADGVYLTTGVKVNDTSFIDAFTRPGQTYYYAVSANKDQDISGRSESVSAAAGTGMVAQWTFDETSGTTVKDSGPFGLKSSTIGNVSLVDGKQGKAASLDPRSYVSVPQNLARWGLNDFTLTAWIKTSSTGGNDFNENTPGIMGSWGDPSNGAGFIVGGLDGSGKIGARIDYNSDVVRSEQSINDGEWHHIAITRDDATNQIQVFVDGQLSATGTSGNPERYSRAWSIGRIDYGMQSFPGTLDEVRIYNRPLNASEVEQIYQGSNN
ncbi:MAG: hypothetical protein GFH27_549287n252 [Chloroflexi bacterium AL-W]|nr:hypothetical protein [Chloroflexi bacterium AL-N1]NOK66526.1 hypothetical protein [Chloroflexi bacterium AL-N10]NOK71914.1 hypothetical protein [Chloroflexi bacterium AL-N5]NOK81171.1 hypothetical protein [Chloroflexi bacterium AL-W]NOK89444.1 hypothetical protein [Chloroflexi bacterium AL-N15]